MTPLRISPVNLSPLFDLIFIFFHSQVVHFLQIDDVLPLLVHVPRDGRYGALLQELVPSEDDGAAKVLLPDGREAGSEQGQLKRGIQSHFGDT
jgi:hypothetical protein